MTGNVRLSPDLRGRALSALPCRAGPSPGRPVPSGGSPRTETVICDTRDFGIGRRVCLENWNALRAVGEHASQRLCDAEAADAQPAPDTVTFAEVTRPTTTAEGLHAPALRFGDPASWLSWPPHCGSPI
jgi:hypothetical protein